MFTEPNNIIISLYGVEDNPQDKINAAKQLLGSGSKVMDAEALRHVPRQTANIGGSTEQELITTAFTAYVANLIKQSSGQIDNLFIMSNKGGTASMDLTPIADPVLDQSVMDQGKVSLDCNFLISQLPTYSISADQMPKNITFAADKIFANLTTSQQQQFQQYAQDDKCNIKGATGGLTYNNGIQGQFTSFSPDSNIPSHQQREVDLGSSSKALTRRKMIMRGG